MLYTTIVRCLSVVLIAITFSAMSAQSANMQQKKNNHNRSTPSQEQQSQNNPQKKDAASKSEQPRKLYKFTVHGHRLSRICNLEVIKLALKRSFSVNPAHANDIVCRVLTLTGTHVKANAHLFCERIGTIIKRQNQFANTGSGMSFLVSQMDLNLPKINRVKLRTTLDQLPDKLSRTCFEPK